MEGSELHTSPFSHSRGDGDFGKPGTHNPNGTALQTSLVPTIDSGVALAAEVREHDLAGYPISVAYDAAGCARSDVKMQLGKCARPEEKEKALPAPRGTAYPRCLGNASCSPPQGAGGSNTRTKFVISELLIHTPTEHRDVETQG